MPSLEDITIASPEPAVDIRSSLVPAGDYGLLVGSGRQVLLLNAAKRRDVENGCFKLPPGFLKPIVETPVVFARRASRLANVRRTIRLFDRAVTLQSTSDDGVAQALLPWKFFMEDAGADDARECDLTIESVGPAYIASQKGGRSEMLTDLRGLSLWLSREIGGRIHDCSNWFATLHAGGVVYDGKLFAFPGAALAGGGLMTSLCLEGHPFFGEDWLAVLDDTLRTAALPLAIRVPGSGFGQPPPHGIQNARIEAIVFPHRDTDAQPEWRRLALIETIFEMLASESGPVENTAESWRRWIVALDRTPAFEMHYASVEESRCLLENIARECRNKD